MKRDIIYVLLIILSMGLTSATCGKQDPDTRDEFSVSLIIPGSVDVSVGGTVEFAVKDGLAPLVSDVVLLTSENSGVSVSAAILSSSASKISFRLPSSITASGFYKISVKRGERKKELGSTWFNIVAKLDFEPDASSTIYGQVRCNGKGVADVVLSDGVEVVKTNEDGYYQIASKKAFGYIFVSVPSGYEVPTEGALPKLHYMLKNDASTPERVDFVLYNAPSQEKFKLLVFGDIHLANRTRDLIQFRDFMEDVSSYQRTNSGEPIYGLTLGDMTWDLYWFSNKFSFPEYLQTLDSGIKGLPIYQTMGNHDNNYMTYSDRDAAQAYVSQVAPTFYSYNIGKWHFIVLDDIDCSQYDGTTSRTYTKNFTPEQFSWLQKDLAMVPADTPLVISTHAQIFYPSGTSSFAIDGGNSRIANTTQFLNIIGNRKAHIFTGHTHIIFNVTQDESIVGGRDIFEHNSGAVCGTWWWTGYYSGINISTDGSPGGYQIVSFDGRDISWQYKATGKSEDFQFRTYDRNAMDLSIGNWAPDCTNTTAQSSYAKYASYWTGTSSSNYVYFNVWNYNPRWTISVTENGNSLDVKRVDVYDPLHIVSYVAPRVNENSTSLNFATNINRHTFRVTAESPASTLEFRISDEFGNVYSETMKRPKTFSINTYK